MAQSDMIATSKFQIFPSVYDILGFEGPCYRKGETSIIGYVLNWELYCEMGILAYDEQG